MLEAEFGSYESWEKDFRATGSVRGIGWAILYQDSVTGRLHNFWINEHDKGHAAGCIPIIVMDAWEHAYMLDYGIKRAGYIDAFFRNLNWEKAQSRVSMGCQADRLTCAHAPETSGLGAGSLLLRPQHSR